MGPGAIARSEALPAAPAPDPVAALVAEREAAAIAAVEAARATVDRLSAGRWTPELDSAKAALFTAESSDWLPPAEGQRDRRYARAEGELRERAALATAAAERESQAQATASARLAELRKQPIVEPHELVPLLPGGRLDRDAAATTARALDPRQLQPSYAVATALATQASTDAPRAIARVATEVLRAEAAARGLTLTEPPLTPLTPPARQTNRGHGRGG